MDKPLLTILLPTMNRCNLLKLAVNSILNQTDKKDLEVIILNNSSVDNTKEYLLTINDKLFKIYHNEEKLNISENWQKALKLSTGKYFYVLGDDDYLFPNFVESIKQIIKNKSPDLLMISKIDYVQQDSIYGWQDIVFSEKKYTSEISSLDPKKLMLSYLNFASNKYLPLTPHPSLFVVKNELRVSVEKYTNCPFFHTVYPDYFAFIGCGLKAKNMFFYDKELVCIGGVEQKNYCYDNSKIEVFLNLDDYENDENKYLLEMPYLSTSIYYQILKNINIYSLENIDKDSLKKTAYKLALDNVLWCKYKYKNSKYNTDLNYFKDVLGDEVYHKILKEFKFKMLKANINKILLRTFSSFYMILRNYLSKKILFLKYKNVKNIEEVVVRYLE